MEARRVAENERKPRKWPAALSLLVLALLLVGGLVGLPLLQAEPEPEPVPTPTPKPTINTVTPIHSYTPLPSPTPEGELYEVAVLSATVNRYDEPGGEKTGTVPGSWYGYPSKLLVIDRQDGFLQVRLQRRPNEDTAWIKESDAEITTTDYRIKLVLKERRVYLYKNGEEVFTAPVGIGKKATPTPKGHYFVTMQATSPGSGYGPFIVVISAHSETIKSFKGSGDAIIAFHGPVGSDSRIGTKGAAISNGCIRMHLDDLDKLEDVPAGSPVDIV